MTTHLNKSSPIILEWNTLDYAARCCLGSMAGLSDSFVANNLAKQNKDEIENWIKAMLIFNLQNRTQGHWQFDFDETIPNFPKL